MITLHVTDRAGGILTLDVETGQSLMEVLRELDHGVEAICGGMCACATCHVLLEPQWYGKVGGPRGDEFIFLEELESYDPQRSRLSCQIPLTDELDGMTLTVGPEE